VIRRHDTGEGQPVLTAPPLRARETLPNPTHAHFRASVAPAQHVTVVGELSRQGDVYDLFGISEAEQELVAQVRQL